MPERYGRLSEVTSCVVDFTKLASLRVRMPFSWLDLILSCRILSQSSFCNRTIGKCEMIMSPRLSVDDKRTRFGTKCTGMRLFERTHGGFAL
jgi:hypothetical protein